MVETLGHMTHKPGKSAINKQLVELRREGIEALHRFHGISRRLEFYEKCLTLSRYYDVRLAGPFLVIKGGKSADIDGQGSSEQRSSGRSNE
jgi:hypothetical protein